MPRMFVTVQLCIVLVCCIAITKPSAAQTAAAYQPLTGEQVQNITFSPRHLVVSLAGEWERSFNESEARTVTLPLSETDVGTFRYRRSFTIKENLLKQHTWHLYCLGVNYRSDVRLNGTFLGSHIGGSVPFVMRIPESSIRKGLNSIEFSVDNELNSFSTIPLLREPFGAKTYGGIYREVFLVGTPHIWVDNFAMAHSFSTDYGRCDISARVMLASGAIENLELPEDSTGPGVDLPALGTVPVRVTAELVDSEQGITVASGTPHSLDIEANRQTEVEFAMAVDAPRLWSPDAPNVYTLKVYVHIGERLLEEYSRLIGLRDVQVRRQGVKTSIFLNGAAFDMKGVEYVENHAPDHGTLNVADFERDVISLKTLGANTVRIRHSAPHPYLVHLCNRYGLFLLTELPVVQVPRSLLQTENYIATAENSMREILSVYEVHPSVLGWGIADGLAEGTEASRQYAERLKTVIRTASEKCIYKVVSAGAPTINTDNFDFIMMRVDGKTIEGFVQETGRLLDMSRAVPAIMVFGRAIQPDNNLGYSDPLSVEAQAKYVRDRFRILQERQLGNGVMIWSFNDYYTDRPILATNNPQPYVATAGMVSASRETRFTYDMVKALFNDENEPFITAGSYKAASPILYTVISIALLIVLFVLINGSRRFRENVVRALVRPYNFYADIRDQRILSNARTVVLALLISATLGMILSSLLYYLRGSYQLDYILVKLIPFDNIKEYVDISIWMPEISILAGTLIFLTVFFLAALIIRIGSFFVRPRIFFNDAFVIAVWAALPVVILLFLTMGLHKVLEFGGFTELIVILIGAVGLWILYRVLRGTAVIYDVWAPNIYAIGVALLSVLAVTILLMYDAGYSLFAYFQYFMDVVYR